MRLPTVTGRKLDISLEDFEKSCLLQIAELENSGSRDVRLFTTLNNAVRLARQHSDLLRDHPELAEALTPSEFKDRVEKVLEGTQVSGVDTRGMVRPGWPTTRSEDAPY